MTLTLNMTNGTPSNTKKQIADQKQAKINKPILRQTTPSSRILGRAPPRPDPQKQTKTCFSLISRRASPCNLTGKTCLPGFLEGASFALPCYWTRDWRNNKTTNSTLPSVRVQGVIVSSLYSEWCWSPSSCKERPRQQVGLAEATVVVGVVIRFSDETLETLEEPLIRVWDALCARIVLGQSAELLIS